MAEVAYRPTAYRRTYRLIIVRQTIVVEEGQARLFDEIRYRPSVFTIDGVNSSIHFNGRKEKRFDTPSHHPREVG